MLHIIVSNIDEKTKIDSQQPVELIFGNNMRTELNVVGLEFEINIRAYMVET